MTRRDRWPVVHFFSSVMRATSPPVRAPFQRTSSSTDIFARSEQIERTRGGFTFPNHELHRNIRRCWGSRQLLGNHFIVQSESGTNPFRTGSHFVLVGYRREFHQIDSGVGTVSGHGDDARGRRPVFQSECGRDARRGAVPQASLRRRGCLQPDGRSGDRGLRRRDGDPGIRRSAGRFERAVKLGGSGRDSAHAPAGRCAGGTRSLSQLEPFAFDR
jgi:hypothetical protein